MFIRVVKLTIQDQCIDDFHKIFDEKMKLIRHQAGCQHLELWQDQKDERVFFTYSWWQRQSDLDAYKKSDLFASIWPKVKKLFDDRPEAYSLNQITTVE